MTYPGAMLAERTVLVLLALMEGPQTCRDLTVRIGLNPRSRSGTDAARRIVRGIRDAGLVVVSTRGRGATFTLHPESRAALARRLAHHPLEGETP